MPFTGLEAGRRLPVANSYALGTMDIQAVLFDLDFTLAKPGPDLGPEGYERLGRRFGLELDPSRYKGARAKAVEDSGSIPTFAMTRRSGSPSPSESSAGWAATPTLRTSSRWK